MKVIFESVVVLIISFIGFEMISELSVPLALILSTVFATVWGSSIIEDNDSPEWEVVVYENQIHDTY